MILRFDMPGDEEKDAFLIESTGKVGVCVKRWSTMRPHLGTFYKKIVIRHLDFDRSDRHIELLEHFLKEVHGAKYGLKPRQLMRQKTIKQKQNEEGKETIDKGRTFFCSELVAKAYKMCEIMKPTDQACSNFLPCDFSTAKTTL